MLSAARAERRWTDHPRWFRWAAAFLALLLLAFLGYAGLLVVKWPYRYASVIPALERIFNARIQVRRYRCYYFPHPGFAAEGMILRRDPAPGAPPLATVERVAGRSDYRDLFFQTGHCRMLTILGAQISVPANGAGAAPPESKRSHVGRTIVDQIVVKDSVVRVASNATLARSPFAVRWLSLRHVTKDSAMEFSGVVINPLPRGEIAVRGRLGPIRTDNPGPIPLSGTYEMKQADFRALPGFAGLMDSRGEFGGTLQHLNLKATAQANGFTVPGGQPVPMALEVRAIIDGTRGDVLLGPLRAQVFKTVIFAQGGVTGKDWKAAFHFAVNHGRIEDLLRLFTNTRPGMVGDISLRAQAELPSNPAPFLRRLLLAGTFKMNGARFTDRATEERVSAMSMREQRAGKQDPPVDPPDPPAEVDGNIAAAYGVAHVARLDFRMPGLHAEFHGPYVLQGSRAHLVGELRTRRNLSHATTGWEAILLRPLAPFFRRKRAGAQIPIALTGSNGHYTVGPDVTGGR